MVAIPSDLAPIEPYRVTPTPLRGKVAVITGASANIGAALARTLFIDGASVVVHYRSDHKRDQANDLVSQIIDAGGAAIAVQADLSVPEQYTALVDATFDTFGRWDILINTAGHIVRKPVAGFTEAEYDSVFDSNAKTVFFMMREAARRMSDDGRILSFVTTMVGALAPTYSAYAGSKAPVEHFSKSLAKEVGERGITVNCIAPGPLQTSFLYPAESDDNIAWLKSMSINGDIGRAEDVLPVARQLILPESNWTTAQTLYVNGGIVHHQLAPTCLAERPTPDPRRRDHVRSPSTSERSSMTTSLPTPVHNLIDATNAGDLERFLSVFTDDGAVDDWGRVFRGRDAIKDWSDAEYIGKQITLDVTSVDRDETTTTVIAQVGGNGFNGPSTFTFSDDGHRVRLMTIRE